MLVVDAGTVLSLTRVDGEGRFQGGRLMAGLALQLRAMAGGTAALPAIEAPEPIGVADLSGWPVDTRQAMAAGVTLGLAAAVTAAALEVVAEEPACRILLTGGDAPTLLDRIVARGDAADLPLRHSPDSGDGGPGGPAAINLTIVQKRSTVHSADSRLRSARI